MSTPDHWAIRYRANLQESNKNANPSPKRAAMTGKFNAALDKAKEDPKLETAKEDEKKKKVEEGKKKIVKSELLVSSNAQSSAVKDTKFKTHDDER